MSSITDPAFTPYCSLEFQFMTVVWILVQSMIILKMTLQHVVANPGVICQCICYSGGEFLHLPLMDPFLVPVLSAGTFSSSLTQVPHREQPGSYVTCGIRMIRRK